FVHLILLSARPGEVLPTVASRCQHVRFEAPSAERLALRLEAAGVEPGEAGACSRLALGDAERAFALATGDGPALRDAGQAFATAALAGDVAERPWTALGELAKAAGERAGEELAPAHAEELELAARSERARIEREHQERVRRVVRRHAAR